MRVITSNREFLVDLCDHLLFFFFWWTESSGAAQRNIMAQTSILEFNFWLPISGRLIYPGTGVLCATRLSWGSWTFRPFSVSATSCIGLLCLCNRRSHQPSVQFWKLHYFWVLAQSLNVWMRSEWTDTHAHTHPHGALLKRDLWKQHRRAVWVSGLIQSVTALSSD